ncbi:MAG: phosphate/phosphite/phosphonate ABC transporter substrate-binding protein [Nitrospirae bacterium]|nr:phosphate/phosphite/phosphonate ABC transporter substrate-binding protein [Nitrospirota bacterium]
MRERLELKILTVVMVLLILGIFSAAFMVLTIEKKSLYGITESSLESTATIVSQDISRTMLDGKAEVTKAMIQELKGLKSIQELAVIHYDGHQAFSSDSQTSESAVMKRLAETKKAFSVRDVKKLTYYKPLMNEERCKTCHATDPALLGAVKISLSIEKEYRDAVGNIILVISVTILAAMFFSAVLWFMIRRMVIKPVKAVEDAAQKLSEGDLSFDVEITSTDEIGRASKAINQSMFSLSGILRRIKDVTKRVNHVVQEVESESRKIVEGALLETEAIANISSSIEEMNAAISDIADGTEGLAASAEETAASMEEMVTSIAEITNSTQDLSIAVEATSSSIEQLYATSREVSSNSATLVGTAQETQAAIMEIAAAVKEVDHRAKESSILSEQVKRDASTFGMTSIGKTIQGMQDIKKSVEKTADYIEKLGGRSEEIGQILTVIDDITDQTTLLALNAAILAAQAGEHGKGFSVVADEIKQLADRTSISTQEIGHLIQSVQQEVSEAVDAMKDGLKSVEVGFKVTQEAADALRKIVESSTKSSEMAGAIERSTAEQSKATFLVSEAMEKVLNMVGQITNAMAEQFSGIQLIKASTEKMRDVSNHVRTATNEQSLNSKQISQAIEVVSDKSQQISRAINEQKIGSNQIWSSIEKIKDIPAENKDRSYKLNQLVKELHKDAELASTEMERLKLTGEQAVSGGVLRLGIVPIESPALMFKHFSPLAEYLSRTMKRKVDLKVAVDFQGAIRDLEQGVTQFCFMGPSTYNIAHEKCGARVLVKALNNGKPFHKAAIITRSDSGINTMQDIKGRSFAFGDVNSTSSHIVPRAVLLAEGIDLKDLLYYNYLGHHDDVLKAVLNGDFDAGGVKESAALRHRDMGLKVLKLSEDIPEFNFTVAADIDGQVLRDLKAALLALKQDDPETKPVLKAIYENYTGFIEADDEDYANIRVMMSKIGL